MKKPIFFFFLYLITLCQVSAQQYEYVPLVREGVQWVNEKVIINHGDTTRYYYKYEFSGMDTMTNLAGEMINHALYYYTGNQLDVEKDSLIAGLCQGDSYAVTFFRNDAYWDAYYRDRLMCRLAVFMDGGTTVLYWFGRNDNGQNRTIEYFVWMSEELATDQGESEPLITTDNFVEVDSVEIEGYKCGRCAYLGEDGEPQAYIVEGIGFDSYEMGDMLTPFTKRPDPNADYQEYCGLSHVVKDGKIIYKGMRYRHGAFTGIDEVEVADRTPRPVDPHYYNLMGQPVGTEVPTAPGIYIHNGNKIIVR